MNVLPQPAPKRQRLLRELIVGLLNEDEDH
jgi:hypothetical protein